MADKDHGMPGTVVLNSDEVYPVNGHLRRGVELAVSAEVFDQYRAGYRCIACHHFPQPTAFPEKCVEPYCGFPMRREQSRRIEFEFRGESDLWPTRSDDELRDDLHDQGVWLPDRN